MAAGGTNQQGLEPLDFGQQRVLFGLPSSLQALELGSVSLLQRGDAVGGGARCRSEVGVELLLEGSLHA